MQCLHVLPVLLWVFFGYTDFLPQAKETNVRLIVESKFDVGVDVSMNGWLCASPVIDWEPA